MKRWLSHKLHMWAAQLHDSVPGSGHREVNREDFRHITYRGVGLAAFEPNPKIKWRDRRPPDL